MVREAGKWVPLEKFAQRKSISKTTVYGRIRRGEVIKRTGGGRVEVFVASPKGRSSHARTKSDHDPRGSLESQNP